PKRSDCLSPADKIGEVIQANTTEFVAQSYELHQPPPFGSLVKTREGEVQIFGVVRLAATTPLDPGRRPLARGRGEESEEDIYRSHPQLSQLLRTEFTALVVGHRDGERCRQSLPPRPARIHGLVYPCEEGEMRDFAGSFDFIHTLMSGSHVGGPDDLIAALVGYLSRAHEDRRAFQLAAGKELAVLLRSELSRLNVILRRIQE
ncbi:MAG: hypothetical protein V3S82_10865, partial [Dehalococcoidia bacterium]